MDQTCGKSFRLWTVLQTPIHQVKPCHTTVALSPTPKQTFLWTTMAVSASSICQKLIMISTVISKNNLTHHLLKVVLLFKWASCFLLLKRWQYSLNLFLNHLVPWPSRNCYLYSTYLFFLLTVHESGESPSSFHNWKLGNLFSVPSILHLALLNFWKEFLLILFTIWLRRRIGSVDSNLGTELSRKPLPLQQTPSSMYLFPALSRLLMRRFAIVY